MTASPQPSAGNGFSGFNPGRRSKVHLKAVSAPSDPKRPVLKRYVLSGSQTTRKMPSIDAICGSPLTTLAIPQGSSRRAHENDYKRQTDARGGPA